MFLASTLGKAKVVADAKTVVLIAASDSRPIGSQVKRRHDNRYRRKRQRSYRLYPKVPGERPLTDSRSAEL
jgi:hypothetical protein